jgi:hypothetical protein
MASRHRPQTTLGALRGDTAAVFPLDALLRGDTGAVVPRAGDVAVVLPRGEMAV